MALKQRLIVAGLFAGLALSALATAKHFSSAMIAYVVEEALVQKMPPGYDSRIARDRFHTLMSRIPDRRARLEKLLFMSQYLETLQVLAPRELDELLAGNAGK